MPGVDAPGYGETPLSTLTRSRAVALAASRHLSLTAATPASVRASLEHSVYNGCAHAVMLGAGEAYLAAFAISLSCGSLVIGMLAALPLLAGIATDRRPTTRA